MFAWLELGYLALQPKRLEQAQFKKGPCLAGPFFIPNFYTKSIRHDETAGRRPCEGQIHYQNMRIGMGKPCV